MQEFKVPELGENIEQGDVTRVLVKVGDTIAKEQPVVELETDKATIEVPSSVAGTVKEIKVKAGEKVKVGAVILTVDDGAAAAGNGGGAATQAAAEPRNAPEARAAEAKPEPKQEQPKQEQKVLSMPRREQASAALQEPAAAAPPSASRASAEQGGAPKPSGEARKQTGPAAPASPSVRRLAREVGIDINDVQGSGPGGRISDADVKEHARRILSSVPSLVGSSVPGAGARPAGVPVPTVPLPDFERWGPVERQPMTNIRRKTAERLGHAWNVIPHVTQCDKADITPMEELRSKFRKQVEQAGGNLTVTAVLVKVLAAAVKQFPQFNASLDEANSAIVYKKYINVGVAVDTEFGLLVPVIRQADQKNITQIAIELQQLSEKARARKLTLDEMSGGGISISNLGGIGGTYFTPIVNWPEVAILGVSRGIIEPVWRPSTLAQGASSATDRRDGTFEPRQLLPLSLSYDHRVIDGADAMRFLRWVVQAIEQPFLLSLLG
jgi:pyruvate dehydrogenase E2 component (dihydrolipoamide acetyltransferase)